MISITIIDLNSPLIKVEIRKCRGIEITWNNFTVEYNFNNEKGEKVVSIRRMCPVVNIWMKAHMHVAAWASNENWNPTEASYKEREYKLQSRSSNTNTKREFLLSLLGGTIAHYNTVQRIRFKHINLCTCCLLLAQMHASELEIWLQATYY